ncbi:MAG: hypothetical protein ACJA0Q_001661 [Saprospiraceae bacterium]|jgi:hypothetical protein
MGSLALLSNSHIKQYEVFFPSGSSFITAQVQEQVVKIYNQIPELQYSTIKCQGVDDKCSNNSLLHTLARERAKNIQEIFLLFGMQRKHVKLSYNTIPFVLIFKPKAQLRTSSLVTKELGKHKESHTLQADKKSYLISNQNHLYIFAAYSFEDENGTVIKKGEIDIKLTELCTNEHVVKCGVAGKQNTAPQEYGMYFNITALHEGGKLKLRQGYVFKILVDNKVVKHDMSSYKGTIIDQVMVWRKNKHAKVHQKYFSKGEVNDQKKGEVKSKKLLFIKEGYKTELIMNNLGWNKCMKTHECEKRQKMLVSLVFKVKHAVYLVSNETKMIISGLENLNFKDLYEFENVPKDESFQIVALPIDIDFDSYVFQHETNTNSKFSSLAISHCAGSSAYDCVHIK